MKNCLILLLMLLIISGIYGQDNITDYNYSEIDPIFNENPRDCNSLKLAISTLIITQDGFVGYSRFDDVDIKKLHMMIKQEKLQD